jgi:hypothetical protein
MLDLQQATLFHFTVRYAVSHVSVRLLMMRHTFSHISLSCCNAFSICYITRSTDVELLTCIAWQLSADPKGEVFHRVERVVGSTGLAGRWHLVFISPVGQVLCRRDCSVIHLILLQL